MAEEVENMEKKRWKCRYCDKDFSSPQNRWRHEQKFHKDEIKKTKQKEEEEDIEEIDEEIDEEDIDGIELFDDEDEEVEDFDIDDDEDENYIYECPECGHTDTEPFDECPECGEELEWD